MSNITFRYIRKAELQHLLGNISRSKLESMVADGSIPRPYKLGKRAVGWRSDEVEAALVAFQQLDTAYDARLGRAQRKAAVTAPSMHRTR